MLSSQHKSQPKRINLWNRLKTVLLITKNGFFYSINNKDTSFDSYLLRKKLNDAFVIWNNLRLI